MPRNPYLNRVMIRQASEFYGRRREVAKIFARIGASRPQSVAVVGERRIGKSSLLNYLCHPEVRRQHLDKPEAYTFVFIDLQEQREIGIPAFFESLFQGIEQALGRERPAALTVDYEGARRALLRLQEEGRKIILLFDEFDAITRNPNFPEEFFAFLRAVANKYDIAYVTTSGQDLQRLCHAERIADSPFFNIFSNLFLTRFEPDEALALIREPSAGAGVPLAPYAADIGDMAGLFPFFLQMACAAFFDALAEGGALDRARVRASFLEEAEPHFNYICEHFDDDQRAVLLDLSEGRPVPPSKAYLVGKLKRDGYLIEHNGRERLFSSVLAACVREGRIQHRPVTPAASATPPLTGRNYPPKPGDCISHFRILQPLAQGGMSLLFTAEDLRLRRLVALKVLPPAVVSDPARKQRFLQEARAASALTHPNIAVVHEVDEVDGVSFIAMERIEGQTLRQRLAAGPMPTTEIVAIGGQVADALGAAHARGIVHRDIKPENVMIADGGRVKVLDFGIAKLIECCTDEDMTSLTGGAPVVTAPGVAMGTTAYMSPEQVGGGPVDHRSDIFSLGVMVYEMATGHAPFAGRTSIDTLHAILHEPAPIEALADAVPPALQRVIVRALEKEPAQRYQSMGDLAADLRRTGQPAVEEGPRPRLRDRVRRWLGWSE